MSTAAHLPEPATHSSHELKLIRGTYEACARIGAQQLSLRSTARELGVSPGLLKYHFGDHDHLLLVTMRWALDGTVRRIQHHLAGVEEPEAALGALLDAVFVSPQENRDFNLVYLDLLQYSARHPTFTGLTDMLRTHVTGSYAAVIQAGVDAGIFHVADITLAAEQARAVVEGGFMQWLQDPRWRTTHAALHANCRQGILRLLRFADTIPAAHSAPRRARRPATKPRAVKRSPR